MVWHSFRKKKNIITIIGLNIKYKNYLRGEIKETKGNEIDGDNIFTKELELRIFIYLILILILENILIILKQLLKKNWIEYGVYEKEKQIGQLEELNSGNNIILNLKGLFYKSGIRNLGCYYIPHKYFFLIRTQIIFRLRLILFKDKKFKNKYKDKKGLLFNYNIFILFIIFRKFENINYNKINIKTIIIF